MSTRRRTFVVQLASSILVLGCVSPGGGALARDPAGQLRVYLIGTGLLLLPLAIGLLLIRRFVARAELTLDDQWLRRRSWDDSVSTIPRGAIGRLERVSADPFPITNAPSSTDYLLVLDTRGMCLLRLRRHSWGTQALDQLVAALGCPVAGDSGETKSVRARRRQYPGAFPWWLAHVQLLVMLLLAVLCAGVAVIQVMARRG